MNYLRTLNREKILSEIIAITKSNFDISEILELSCRKIEEFFDVKRVIPCKVHSKENPNYNLLHICQILEKNLRKKDEVTVTDSEVIKNIQRECLSEIEIEQALIIPIKLEKARLGYLYLFSDETREWEKADLKVLDKIAEYISIAIRETNLYSKSKYIADIAHELRTPVAIIEGYANSLLNREEYSPQTVDKYLNIIKKNTLRITSIIENIITLSQLEDDANDVDISPVEEINVENLINNVIELQKKFMTNKNISFETSCDSSLSVRANEILLEQALLNLVQNAVQYSNDGSEIIINAEKKESFVSISVQDFGCGIEEHDLNNIFKRFYRADKSRSRKTGGSGLGLSIVENIVKTYNGVIRVKSAVGKGSTFTIEIPCF